jgi:3-oxoacyl-[acyl-carrier-protein] synthase II
MVSRAGVPVTGMAWSTALGDDVDDVWRRLVAREQDFTPVPSPFRLRNELAALVPWLDAEDPAARLHALAATTVARALASAGIRAAEATLVIGTSFGSWLDVGSEGPVASYAGWADRIGGALGFADVIAISTACSSGADAIGVALELIRSATVDCCVCGGADVLTESKRLAHSALSTMSPTTIRPFDERHDGTLLGEGAAFLVLESRERARRRGATIAATLAGAGSANDAASMTSPDSEARGARLAIERSLGSAGIGREAIGVVNAHGSGTATNDRLERDALQAVFDEGAAPIVFGTKGSFGHTLGATGALEAIAVIQSLRTRVVAPTAGLERPDPAFRLPLAAGTAVPHEAHFGLSLTLGFGGFDTSLIFEAER